MDNLPWIEKYRPNKLIDIISHKEIIDLLINLKNQNKIPNIIFYGPPGTGKTSTIHSYANEIYGDIYKTMILELNCSDDRGINMVREQIKNFSSTSFQISKLLTDNNNINTIKLIILDEADALTYDAQYALRRVLELYSNTTRFCFICNYITRLIPALQSRCLLFRFSPIRLSDHFDKLTSIEINEKINITDEAKYKIIDISEGDMRKSLNLLQTLYMSYNNELININTIYKAIGYPTIEEKKILLDIFKEKELKKIYNILYEIQSKYNLSNNDIIKEITEYYNTEYINELNKKKYNITIQNKLIDLFDKLANIEVNLVNNVNNVNNNINLMAISSVIYIFNN
jgi:replication factor C subunit 3/5